MKQQYMFSFLRRTLFTLLVFAGISKAFAAIQVVNVANFSFTPSSFSINAGDTVMWVWVSGSHTTTSQGIPAGATTWNQNINSSAGNTSFIYVPGISGTYNYHCSIHPTSMIGSFTVNCAPPSAADAAIVASGPTTFCGNKSVTLSVTKSGLSYLWNTGATTQSITATVSGNYSCSVSNNCGTTLSNTITVTVNPLPTSKVNAGSCSGGAVLLTCTATPNTGVKYKWTKDGVSIPGATNPSFSATVSGSYKCKVTITATGCAKNSKAKVVTINCKEAAQTLSTFVVYPNPSNEFFMVNTSQIDPSAVLEIHDLTGRTIEKYTVTSGDMKIGASLPEGIYFLKITIKNQVAQVIKLVKNS